MHLFDVDSCAASRHTESTILVWSGCPLRPHLRTTYGQLLIGHSYGNYHAANTAHVWSHAVLHGWVGGLRAVYRPRAASRGQGAYAKNQEQTHQVADPDQASRAPHDLLFQNDDDARSGHWSLHQSLRVWGRNLT